jgi:GH24 family phage-related lysozyme (muramidase)
VLWELFKKWLLPKPKEVPVTGIGKEGLELIKKWEGLRLTAYLPTPNDVWTIGYGHTKTAKRGMTITEKQAEDLLKGDLAWVEEALARNVKVPLKQNQYDALASFVYNLGEGNFRSSTLLKLLNAGDYDGAADQLLRWNKQKGKVLRGLTNRRMEERALFLK